MDGTTRSPNWKKVAYVQLVRRHIEACNAVMLFAELERQDSPAQKILLYPKAWEVELENSESVDKNLDTSIRLLRRAAARYAVTLVPIQPIVESDGGKDMQIESRQHDE